MGRRVLASVVAALLSFGAGSVVAQTPVYPGDPSWFQIDPFWNMIAPNGLATITGTSPLSGNGSLQLTTTGNLGDWGYYATLSGANPWGQLADVTGLSFDWNRMLLPYTNPGIPYITQWPDAPWLAQTPVLRLLVGETIGSQTVFSELVWEGFYTNSSPVAL